MGRPPMLDVARVIEEVRLSPSRYRANKELVPVVIIYRKKPKRRDVAFAICSTTR